MQKLNALLDKLPVMPTYLIGVWLTLAPFYPQPHLWEKLNMLFDGTLARPIDIGDLAMHGGFALIALLKLWREQTISPEEKAARDAAKAD